jgi:hypothetical protein
VKYLLIFLVSALFSFSVGTLIINATEQDSDNRSASPTPTVTKTVTVSPTPSVTESPVEKEKSDAKYGQTLQLSEGLQVTVYSPKDYPKDPNVKMVHKYYKLFSVKVKNTTKTTIPRVEEWFVESPGGELTNTEGNGMPGGQLAAGETLTFTVVFGYDDDVPTYFSFMTTPMYEISRAYVWS